VKIRVLGCHGGELPGHRTTCFLIDSKLCVDGGSITQVLEMEDLLKIDDIFLTHSHFDHIKDVPLMTDLLVGHRNTPVIVH
jgi:phosphoribosyl 1,2-cyclic phosphodiesterase